MPFTHASRKFPFIGLVSLFLSLLTVSVAQNSKSAAGYAIIAGTVFNERGFTLRGATISLTPSDPSKLNKQQAKKQDALSDARGEFAFRVPTVAAVWVLKASAKGMQTVEKTVDIEGEVRKDVTFELSAESK
jgi:uncharacterized GH25 family protein